MIFTASQRVSAPRTFVFERATEFDRLAQALLGRGAKVADATPAGGAPRFEVEYPFRDAMWPAALELQGQNPPDALTVAVQAAAVQALADFGFREAEPEVTLVELSVTLKPRNLQGRLLLGSLHVVRGRVQERLEEDLAALARGAEALWIARG